METQAILTPPGSGDGIAIAAPGDYDDDIREIGDKLAGLTLLEAKRLTEYLNSRIEPKKDDGLIACA